MFVISIARSATIARISKALFNKLGDNLTTQPSIEIITGSMFCGKTLELIRRLIIERHALKKILALKHKRDTRTERDFFDYLDKDENFKDYDKLFRHTIDSANELEELIEKHRPHVIAIDEGQFFDSWLPSSIRKIAAESVKDYSRIIISGLDTDYEWKGFGPMPELMAIATDVTKLPAVCMKCRQRSGTLTYRKASAGSNELILVGSKQYETRCLRCHLAENKS